MSTVNPFFSDEPSEQEAVKPATAEAEAVSLKEDALSKRVTELEEEATRLRDQWTRAVAETDNVRKRAQREREETTKYAVTDFAREMVSVLENLKRATETIPAEARSSNPLLKNLGEGIDLTLNELVSIFERNGIRRINPIGEPFDHNFHQAVAQVETPDAPEGQVVQVVQAGYVMHDRLLQPAMVAVAKNSGEAIKKVDTTA